MGSKVGDIIKFDGWHYLLLAEVHEHWLAIRQGSVYPAAPVLIPRAP